MPAIDPRRILIIDRDVASVEPLRQKLCDAGFTVSAVTDGATAIGAVSERPPNLVIIDWNMPGFTALEVIQGVRRARGVQMMRLIILSALPSLTCDELVVEAASNRVTVRGRLVNLRGVEYRLLEFLMSHAGRTINRMQLLAQVWGDDSDVDERTFDVNIQRLRKILSECGYETYIQTVRRYGYRFAAPKNIAST